MEDLILYIVKALVKNPDAVTVAPGEEQDGVTTYNLTVAEEDKGYVIGKQGKIAKAMRTIVRSATPASSKRYVIEIRERGSDNVNTDAE